MKRYGIWIIALSLLALVVAGCGVSNLVARPAPPATAAQAEVAQVPETGVAPAAQTDVPVPELLAALEATLERIYEEVNPSVVHIRIVVRQETPTVPQIPGFPFGESPETPQAPPEFFRQGAGSGFVWDKEGHIVTNNHVVAGADEIFVTFSDGTILPATLVGADPNTDLAVLKVEEAPADLLKPVTIADGEEIKVGQIAIAIGNPFGLEGTMTQGIISFVGRLLPVSTAPGQSFSIPDVIQTDAPINPGNSGGVLLDDHGHVIGVTTAIESPVRGNVGVGYAVPATTVKKVIPALIEQGYYEHPWLGISATSLTPKLAEAMGLESNQRGALVVDVLPDSPADKADLQGSDQQVEIYGQEVRVGGDVIIAINDQPVKSVDDLITYLARYSEVGDEVTLTVLRDGKEETVTVTLEARPREEAQPQAQPGPAKGAWLGIRGTTLTPEVAKAMDLPEDQKGVLIAQVEINSPADEAGLRGSYKPTQIDGEQVLIGGDVIIAIEDQEVAQIEDLVDFLRQAKPGDKVTLTVLRNGEEVEVPVTLGERPAQNQ